MVGVDIFSDDFMKNIPLSGVRKGVFAAGNDCDSNESVGMMKFFFFLTKEGILGGRRYGDCPTLPPPSSGVPDSEVREGEFRVKLCSKQRYFGVCGCSSSEQVEKSSLPSIERFLFGLFPSDDTPPRIGDIIKGEDGIR